MVESHIYVILTCDNCGRTADYEDYDNHATEVAEDVAIETLEWTLQQNKGAAGHDSHLCPDCSLTEE